MKRFGLLLFGVLATAQCGGGDGGGGPPTITAVVVSGDSTVVIAGTRQLTATALSGATPVTNGVTFQWTSSNGTTASVSSAGLVSGSQLGTVTITAQAVLNGTPTGVVSAPKSMRVRIGSIGLTPSAPLFPSLSDTVLVTAVARDALNAPVTGVTFSFQSRTPGVATATATSATQANVVAVANGTTRIVVTGDGVSDSVTATVQQVAVTLSVTPDTVTFGRIDSVLTPVVAASDARGNPVATSAISWLSLNPAVATVNPATGAITSKNEPSTRVIATSGSLTDTVRIGVVLVYGSVQITLGGLTAPIDSALITRLNGSRQLGVDVRDVGSTPVPSPQVTWSLKTGTIASVSGTGLVTGNTNTGRDTVVVVARTVRDSVPLIVRQDVANVDIAPLSPADLNFVGDTQTFTAAAFDGGGALILGKTPTWSTSRGIVSINASGLATADSATSAAGLVVRIRADIDGIKDSVNLLAKQVPNSAALSPGSFNTLTAFGRTANPSCVVQDSAAVTIPSHPCAWTAGTSGVITFNPTTGASTVITAVGNGSTTIFATALTNVFGQNFIQVDQVPATVSLLPANFGTTPDVQMTINQSAPFYAVVRDSNSNVDTRARTDVTWAIAPGTSGTVAPSTSGMTTVTTNATAGNETVTATIGAISGNRVVNVAATGVSYVTSIRTELNNTCASAACHGGTSPMQGLNLTSAQSYANLFNVNSMELPAMKRVLAFRPDSSYMVHKIQGTQATVGGTGVRMPEGCPTTQACLSATTINLIRNWILQGALNN
jgi:hypothetical protein